MPIGTLKQNNDGIFAPIQQLLVLVVQWMTHRQITIWCSTPRKGPLWNWKRGGCILYIPSHGLMVRHAPPKGWKCPVLASYQMWFCQKLLKNAKNHSKIVKIWPFLWKATSGSAEIHNFQFLNNFWPQITQKCQTTRRGFSQKWPNLD